MRYIKIECEKTNEILIYDSFDDSYMKPKDDKEYYEYLLPKCEKTFIITKDMNPVANAKHVHATHIEYDVYHIDKTLKMFIGILTISNLVYIEYIETHNIDYTQQNINKIQNL